MEQVEGILFWDVDCVNFFCFPSRITLDVRVGLLYEGEQSCSLFELLSLMLNKLVGDL